MVTKNTNIASMNLIQTALLKTIKDLLLLRENSLKTTFGIPKDAIATRMIPKLST
jgi:hypothetical protein